MTHTEILNALAAYQRDVLGKKSVRYLEIGVRNPADNFDRVEADYKVGVDPMPMRADIVPMTSDGFFSATQTAFKKPQFDLIFVDGLHEMYQVFRDLSYSKELLSPHGFIVAHDCDPPDANAAQYPMPKDANVWCGNTYAGFAMFRFSHPHAFCIESDYGCGVYWHSNGSRNPTARPKSFSDFQRLRKEAINPVSVDDFKQMLGQKAFYA